MLDCSLFEWREWQSKISQYDIASTQNDLKLDLTGLLLASPTVANTLGVVYTQPSANEICFMVQYNCLVYDKRDGSMMSHNMPSYQCEMV